jgi:hypothetical protein
MQRGVMYLLGYLSLCIKSVPHVVLTWMPRLLIWGPLSELGLFYPPFGTDVFHVTRQLSQGVTL